MLGCGIPIMNETDPPKAETQDGRDAANEREGNALKAREAADCLFPGHEWIKVEDGIYLSSDRATGSNTNYADELRDAQILRDLGSTVYLAPENSRQGKKQHDAIVDGLTFEFKNVTGQASALQKRFLESREQAPNVFINLENSEMTRRQVLWALRRARSSRKYPQKNGSEGRIILKIRGENDLVYMGVDELG